MAQRLRLVPELSATFISLLLSRLIRYEADLVDQMFNSSEKRLAGMLPLPSHFVQPLSGCLFHDVTLLTQSLLDASEASRRGRYPRNEASGLWGGCPSDEEIGVRRRGLMGTGYLQSG